MTDLKHLKARLAKRKSDRAAQRSEIDSLKLQATEASESADFGHNGRKATNTAFRVLIRTAVVSSLIALGISAVASDRVTDKLAPATGQTAALKTHHWFETGIASWYGTHFQGHKTANGEQYDMNSLTCAHRSLPLGSWIRVTNLHNCKSIFVRVNDRGPMTDNRIIDLSYAAAHAVGLSGVGKVKLEPVRKEDAEMQQALTTQMHLSTALILPPR